MPKVNITPATKKIAEDVEMFVEFETATIEHDDGEVIEFDAVRIAEDCSDFFIQYKVMGNGTLELYSKPDYVHGLPTIITSSVQLRNVVKDAVQHCLNA